MSKKRRQYTSEFKAKVALAALKGDETTSALAARFEIHPSMVSQWQRELLDNAAGLFEGSSGKPAQKSQEEVDTVYRETGKLTVRSWTATSPGTTRVGPTRGWTKRHPMSCTSLNH
ncbi:transposase [Halomonas salinarum]|uniref:transposase n=1 Tax=Halomonas salinarum TaxID=1158993 RepID=UPI00143953BF|nr:transposase [Halomonas salinarum]